MKQERKRNKWTSSKTQGMYLPCVTLILEIVYQAKKDYESGKIHKEYFDKIKHCELAEFAYSIIKELK